MKYKDKEIQNILIICTGNTCRSPMAHGLLSKLLHDSSVDGVTVHSMGVTAFDGDEITPNAKDVLAEMDIDMSNHKSRRVMLEDIYESDLIIAMTNQHKKDIVRNCEQVVEDKILVMDIVDPYGKDMEQYRECRNDMVNYLNEFIKTVEL